VYAHEFFQISSIVHEQLTLDIDLMFVDDPQEVVPIQQSLNLSITLLLNSQCIPVNCGELASDVLMKVEENQNWGFVRGMLHINL
jgi:hypothetical protein